MKHLWIVGLLCLTGCTQPPEMLHDKPLALRGGEVTVPDCDRAKPMFYQLGCSNALNLAAQIADPRDVIAHYETTSDVERNMLVIEQYRGGGASADAGAATATATGGQ